MPHFLDLDKISPGDLKKMVKDARSIKADLKAGKSFKPLQDKQLAMIFEKPSTRTRTSFEVGINQLGGNSVILNTENSQLGRGETIADTARVLSRYVDLIMIRCFKHETMLELAEHSSAYVINGLTNFSHPCQIMADIMTFEEHRGSIQGKTVSWIGDGNNMTNSWIHAAAKFGFKLKIATPVELEVSQEVLDWAKNNNADIMTTNDPREATDNSDLVTTDTWVSMGDKDAEERQLLLAPYQVNSELMSCAGKDALFMHCLPAHRDEEVSSEVIDGPQSVIFDEAENRLHIQKAIMIWCLKK